MPLNNKSTADVSNLKVTSDAHISQTNVGTSATVTNINPSISTDVPHISASLSATINTTGAATATNLHPVTISEKPHVTSGVHANTGEATDHRSLKHLDYESSGHTGFASSKDLQSTVSLVSTEGAIDKESLKVLTSNFAAKIDFNGTLLNLSCKAKDKWTYTSALDDNGDMWITTIDLTTGAYKCSSSNPAKSELNAHIRNTSVHLQAGERNTWNSKVSAEVIPDEEKLKLF